MKTITTVKGQTIYDIAVQWYGNVEAIYEIMRLNDVFNDPETGVPSTDFYLDLPIAPGSELKIDDTSYLQRKNVVKEITEPVIGL